jgi:hypothetical protein
MLVDPPTWLFLLLNIGSGAPIGLGVYLFFVWWDHRKSTRD